MTEPLDRASSESTEPPPPEPTDPGTRATGGDGDRSRGLADTLTDSETDTDRQRRTLGAPGIHSAASHKWVIRTSAADQMPTSTRISTSWPLLRMYSRRQVQLRYRQSALGVSWTLIQPIAIMAIYGFIFTQFLQVDGGGDPYLAMAWTGLTIWMYVQGTLQVGTVSLLNDSYMLGRVWFPREIIPLSPVVAGFIDLAMAGVVLVGVIAVQIGGVTMSALTIPIMLYVLVVWVAAISVITATVNVFLRDLATIVSLTLRLLFIATPVMYPASVVPPHLGWVLAANPFAVVINNMRAVLLGQDWPNWNLLALHGVIGTVLFLLGLWYLRTVERRMVDVI